METTIKQDNRQQEIHSLGFAMTSNEPSVSDYNKIKVGVKTLEDAVYTLGDLNDKRLGFRITKPMIYKALAIKDYDTLRRVSEYFYNVSGIYQRLCNYVATLYRYDWYIIPEVLDDNVKEERIVKDYVKILHFLDNSYVKKTCGDIALKVLKYGCYYGYVISSDKSLAIQELPPKYCRTRYSVAGMPAVEFNMRYFDTMFIDPAYRQRVLKLWPEDFQKGYRLFKQGKLPADYKGDVGSWYLLEPGCAFKFNLNGSDLPFFANVIPLIMDLDEVNALARKKQMQELVKIIVQKLPLDKNGDLIFDIDEARDIHNNAVDMLEKAVGIDVLTTFADVEAIIAKDSSTSSTTASDIETVENQIYGAAGTAKDLFNSSGNTAMNNSILEDESTFRNLLLQFGIFYDKIVEGKNTNKNRYSFSFYFLETTQYNYQAIAKLYKEQVQLGYSKMLPQIALGHPQSTIINTTYFENSILHLPQTMIPPLMSSVLSGEDILGIPSQSASGKIQETTVKVSTANDSTSGSKTVSASSPTSTNGGSSSGGGRPEKDDREKSDKTIQNRESMK